MSVRKELCRDFAAGSGIAVDLLSMCIGDFLGSGSYRKTFVYDLDPSKVIKFETGAGDFENVMEWKAWERLKDSNLRTWLAPCRFISPSGSVLIQDRTYEPPPTYKWPGKLPAFMTDLKHSNFGLIGKRLVCHDYGLSLHYRTHIPEAMRKAVW